MELLELPALIVVLVVLAAMPSSSVALVVTRSATFGIRNGAAVASGIVLGDLVFVVLAICGMSALAESMGAFFGILKYAGGAYLIWLGVGLLRSRKKEIAETTGSQRSTLFASFLSGLLLTVGDVKAILFYASLFPAFVDMASLTTVDIVAIVVVTMVAVGGVKLAYAFGARRIALRLRMQRNQKTMRTVSGAVMVGTGTYLIAQA